MTYYDICYVVLCHVIMLCYITRYTMLYTYVMLYSTTLSCAIVILYDCITLLYHPSPGRRVPPRPCPCCHLMPVIAAAVVVVVVVVVAVVVVFKPNNEIYDRHDTQTSMCFVNEDIYHVHPVSVRKFPSFRTSPWKTLAATNDKKITEQPSPWRKSSKRESCYGDRVY